MSDVQIVRSSGVVSRQNLFRMYVGLPAWAVNTGKSDIIKKRSDGDAIGNCPNRDLSRITDTQGPQHPVATKAPHTSRKDTHGAVLGSRGEPKGSWAKRGPLEECAVTTPQKNVHLHFPPMVVGDGMMILPVWLRRLVHLLMVILFV